MSTGMFRMTRKTSVNVRSRTRKQGLVQYSKRKIMHKNVKESNVRTLSDKFVVNAS